MLERGRPVKILGFCTNPDSPWTELDGEIVLMNSVEGSYCVLMGSAASIWGALGPGAGPGEICAQFLGYTSTRKRAVRTLTNFWNLFWNTS